MKNKCQSISIIVTIVKISKASTILNYESDILEEQISNSKPEIQGGGKWGYLLRKCNF